MDVLARALEGTEKRGNASREYQVELCVLGLGSSIRGTIEEIDDQHVAFSEAELSRNGNWLIVDAAPMYIVREVITAARIIYLDGGS